MDEQNKVKPDVVGNTTMVGHILIKDKDTQEVLLNQRDGFVHQPILGNANARQD
jgi:hypothetical protein